MSDLLRLFADASAAIEAGLTSEMTDRGAVFKRDGSPFAEAPIAIDPAAKVDPSKYHSLICHTGHTGERQISGLRSRGGEKPRLGYIFPISSLRSGEFIEDEWEKKYAWAASYKLLSGIDGGLAARFPSMSLLEGDPSITDLFSDHLSVCIVGLSNLKAASIQQNELPLMLMREGIRIPIAPGQFAARASLKGWTGIVNLSPPSSEVVDDIEELTMMLTAADSYESPVGEFLTFYQSIEYVIGKIFNVAVSATVSEKISPWTLKERLGKVATEKWRLSIMSSKCLSHAQSAIFGEVGRACLLLLKSAGEKPDDSIQWWESLYAVRNIVVHGQIRLVRDGNVNLRTVNASLRDACLEVLLSFRLPSADDIWKAQTAASVELEEQPEE